MVSRGLKAMAMASQLVGSRQGHQGQMQPIPGACLPVNDRDGGLDDAKMGLVFVELGSMGCWSPDKANDFDFHGERWEFGLVLVMLEVVVVVVVPPIVPLVLGSADLVLARLHSRVQVCGGMAGRYWRELGVVSRPSTETLY
eukprot:CAMPEP_0118977710 /NCGR_PEP_ID=MMETSP1173-20130426/22093_1 /TAXON_ID=1034831 /ORGANISM="Rhizochromulina marina cf, Strain CCMP1243" /LENGTH=141 /DNA_ID=CAMNT_0006927847 /DNA_START=164 /DNA_END=590 /DNA_ORIENTATION=+